MLQYYSVLKHNTLFKGFTLDEFCKILTRLNAKVKTYKKNEVIRHADTPVLEVGFILEGLVYLSKIDYDGNRVILHELRTGNSFGESLAFTNALSSPIIVTAAQKCKVLTVQKEKMLALFENGTDVHARVTSNLIRLLSEKIMLLQMKNDILSQKTIREKLMLYFEYESKSAKSNDIKISFSRDELADFLSMNVSALSRELGKMRDEGILTFKKNKFILLG